MHASDRGLGESARKASLMGRLLMSGMLRKGRPVGSQLLEAWELAVSRAHFEGDKAALDALVAIYDGEVAKDDPRRGQS